MSVSGISNSQSLALYLLQHNQNAAKQSSNTDTSQSFPASSSLDFDVSSADDSDEDGTYSMPDVSNGTDPSGMSSFVSDLQSLLTAAQSGDATSAQTAASAVEKDLGLSTSDTASVNATASDGSNGNTFMSDLTSLISAVQSGDMTTAQTAANSVQQDLQSMMPPPPPPPPSGSDANGSNAASTTESSSSTSASDELSAFINDLSDLLNATSSNDVTSAQTAATKVQNDLNALTSSSSDTSSSSSATSSASTSDSQSTASDTVSSDTLAQDIMQSLMNVMAQSLQQNPSMLGMPS